MSEDKNNEEEEQERKNEFFEDGDDFGLPDLEYDELEEGEEDEPLEEEIDFDIQSDSSDDQSDSEDDDSSLDFGGEEAPSYDEADISTDDLSEEDFEISDEELEGIDLENVDVDNFQEEEGAEGFDEGFTGFEPDPEAAAFAAESSEAAVAAENYKELADRDDKGSEYHYSDEKSRSSFTKIVIIGTVVILALASVFLWYSQSQKAAKEEARLRAEQAQQREAERKKQEALLAARDTVEVVTPPVETAPPASTRQETTPGEIKTISSRTGNSYIVVGSFVDSDLAMDFAKKLAAAGESPTIIEPPGNQLFYRVAVASFNSYQEASSSLGDFRPDYGAETWALRY